jgi:hypothetical protein
VLVVRELQAALVDHLLPMLVVVEAAPKLQAVQAVRAAAEVAPAQQQALQVQPIPAVVVVEAAQQITLAEQAAQA